MNNTNKLEYDIMQITAGESIMLAAREDGEAILVSPLPHNRIVVGTHAGEFHADEVLSIALLRVFLSKELRWVRSRDPRILGRCDLRIDVGEGLLDHHGSRAAPGIAACSRVFRLLQNSGLISPEVGEALAPLVEATAATDTGVISSVNVNPWVHAACAAARVRGEDPDAAFGRCVDTMATFVADLVEAAQARATARAAAEREMCDQGNAPIVIFSAASRLADVKKLMWERKRSCIYFISPEGEEDWRILCAADPAQEYSAFSSRRLIPEKFRGLRDEDLSDKAGIPGGIFCHAAGFIAGFQSRDAAIKFAEKCLED